MALYNASSVRQRAEETKNNSIDFSVLLLFVYLLMLRCLHMNTPQSSLLVNSISCAKGPEMQGLRQKPAMDESTSASSTIQRGAIDESFGKHSLCAGRTFCPSQGVPHMNTTDEEIKPQCYVFILLN